MAEIIGKIVKEIHTWKKVYVMRPYGNETIVQPSEDESIDSILISIQRAIDMVLPYVRNCPTGNWTGRATTYITVQPIFGDNREEISNRLKDLKSPGAILMRDSDFDGRLQLILFTPSPDDPITPVGQIDTGFDMSNLYRIIKSGSI